MIKHNNPAIILIVLAILASSCVTTKRIKYLQYAGGTPTNDALTFDQQISVTPATYRLMPNDILFIRVITPDPQWSEIFNVTTSGSGGSLTGESASLLGYPVDAEGYIEMPFVEKIKVGGLTLAETKEELKRVFKDYLKDAAITVRLVNNFISVLGEVGSPGRYPLTKDQINIFEAIAMAGDMMDYGDRQKVQIIRPSPYGPLVKEFSVSDRSILNSEFYYVMPNDIIYAQPRKGRTFQLNSSVTSTILSSISTILGLITTFYVVYNLGNANQ